MANSFKQEDATNYIEGLKGFMSFYYDLNLKKLSNNPLKYKLYGFVLEEHFNQLKQFFDSLPSDQKVLIDVSNIDAIAGTFDSLLKESVEKNKSVIWYHPNEQSLNRLQHAGVSDSNIQR
jgi:hypothetical protein